VVVSRLLGAVAGITAGLDLPATLHHIVDTATDLAGARYGAIGVLDRHGQVVEFVHTGLDHDRVSAIGRLPIGRGVLGLVVDVAKPLRLADLTRHPDAAGFPPHHPMMRSFLGVPVRIGTEVFGNLYLCEKRGAAEFTEDDEVLVESLAAIAAVAIENSRLHGRLQDLAVLADRERIARDLHDKVIQRLFAAGMTLQAAVRLPTADLAERVEAAVDELDAVVNDIRQTIFDLTVHPHEHRGLTAAVLAVVDDMTRDTGLAVSVRLAPDLDHRVDARGADATVTALREILANTVRHAAATSVDVDLSGAADDLVMVVTDDGCGPHPGAPTPGHGHGLHNLAARAEALGGTFRIAAHTAPGTRVVWTIRTQVGT